MVTCGRCGQENPEGFRFCGRCGADLTAPATAGGEERKVVSVLFCDLVGFTASSERADPEDVRAALRVYHDRVRSEIERFDGTVEKFIGDAVMAVFGAPVAHEDDAERAVRAGLRILGAIEELNEEHPHLGLAVRIGVNTGEAVVALAARPQEGEGMVAGDVVNTAARLQGAAPVGTVVVGQTTHRMTRDQIEYEPMEPVTVKGKAEPVALWRAVSPRGRYGVDVEQTTDVPFLGREKELDLLTGTFHRTVGEAAVQLVTITGEPGVGKTRLLWEFKRNLDDDPGVTAYWRQGRCLPYGDGVTFWALGEMVKGQAGILESDSPEQAAEKLAVSVEAVVEDERQREWLVRRIGPLVGAASSEEAADRDESFGAWRAYLEAIASRYPLILVFEDLHWADPAVTEFVEHLVDWSTGVPILVVCSARPELFERHPGWGGGKRNSTTIGLSPLGPEDTARLFSALLSQAVLPADVQAVLLERTGGNPLYAEEFVRMLADRGQLERRGRTSRLVPGSAIDLPESVHAIIASRLDTLAPDRKALLQAGSVVGKVFWSGVIAELTERAEKDVRAALQELGRRELVRPARTSSVKDQAEYAFWHALVRDVAYRQIPRASRADLHRRVAAWIEAVAGERVEDHADFLSYHLEQAIELTRAAGGQPDPDLIDGARRFLELAGDRSEKLDLPRASALYERALAFPPGPDVERARLLRKSADAAAAAGSLDQEVVQARFAESSELFERVGMAVEAGRSLHRLASFVSNRRGAAQAVDLMDRAVAMLEPEGPSQALAEALSAHAGNDMMAGHSLEGLANAGRALALADQLGLGEVRQRALQFRGILRILGDDLDGLDDLREALRMGLDLGTTLTTTTAYDNLGDWLSQCGSPLEGLAVYEEGIRFADARGLGPMAMWQRAETTWRLFDLGRWDEVTEVAAVVERWSAERGDPQPGLIAGTQRVRVRAFRGDLAGASEEVPRLLEACRLIGDVQILAPGLGLAIEVATASGRDGEAATLLEELRAFAGGDRIRALYGLHELLPVLEFQGDPDRIEAFLPPGQVAIAVPGRSQRHGRAMVDLLRGRPSEAADALVSVATSWAEIGHVFDRARALLWAGEACLEVGRDAEAQAHLRDARATFADLRAVGFLERTDEALTRALARSS